MKHIITITRDMESGAVDIHDSVTGKTVHLTEGEVTFERQPVEDFNAETVYPSLKPGPRLTFTLRGEIVPEKS